LGIAQFAFLLWLACRHAHFLLMMDLWHYANVLAVGGTREEQRLTDELLDAAERRARDQAGASGLDETVVVGHSIGAALAVELTDRLLTAKMQVPVNVLTLGSGFLQVALHPKASRFRDMAKRVLQSKAPWLDVQALIDPINFLHSNLDKTYGIAAPNYREIIIRMRHVLSDATYRRIKYNLFRVHRQFVLPVEMKQHYSFHKIVSGPVPFADIVRMGGLPESDIKQGHLNADAAA
jgi:pimeloyl-ACP methyl ester carboxylesterase